jgi:uncharacterized protein
MGVPLRVHLDKIGPNGLDLDQPVTTAWLNESLGTSSPFSSSGDGRLQVHLECIEDAVYVRGRVSLSLDAECSRCLGPAPLALNTPFSVTLFPKGHEPPSGEDGEIDADDMGVGIYENKEIDLSGIVHDEVFLELPMNPVCSGECAGLCAICGQNLNEGECSCQPHPDPRWQALRQLKVD